MIRQTAWSTSEARPRRWLPDEFAYSYCARFHRLAGSISARDTERALFGFFHYDAKPIFLDQAGDVEAFAAHTGGTLGEAESIMREHTTLPIFLRFVAPAVRSGTIEAARSGTIGRYRSRLGLNTPRFLASTPLKACEACMAEDSAQFHVPYWHRTHQLPGVWICPVHRQPLRWTAKMTFKHPRRWLLPDEVRWVPRVGIIGATAAATAIEPAGSALGEPSAALAQVADLAIWLSALPLDAGFDVDVLQATYRAALDKRGLWENGLDTEQAGCELMQFAGALRPFPGFVKSFSNAAEAALHVQATTLSLQAAHPLWHIPLIAWLFGSWPEFVRQYEKAVSA